MDDVISRQQAIDALENCYCGGEDSCGEPWIYEEHALNAIKQLPPIEPKQVKSRWEPVQIWSKGRVCMECGTVFEKVDIGNGKANFCPNCGCDMRGEQDE